jgi:streptomycin 6-kinase
LISFDASLEHYLSAWGLSDPRLLEQTPTSHIYTVTQDALLVVLKILTPVGVEERVGALALRHFNGHGAVRLLRCDQGAHLLEYANGENLAGLVQQGRDQAATEVIADVINALHTNHDAPPEGIITLRRWFRALFVQAEHDRKKGLNSIFVRAAPIADAVLAQPQEPRVLHGDIHHENIRQSSRGWLAFDPKGLYGERTYDLANTLCNPRPIYGVAAANEARILRNAGILAERCGIERSRVLLFLYLYACLSASWTLEAATTGWEMADILPIAEIAERHLNLT